MDDELDPFFKDRSLYRYDHLKFFKQVKRKFRLLDIYALPITLRYKGEKKFYTNFGALTSLFIILLVLGMAGVELQDTLLKTSSAVTSVTKLEKEKDITERTPDAKNSFGFGFHIMMQNGTKLKIENFRRYITPKFVSYEYRWSAKEKTYIRKELGDIVLNSCQDMKSF